MNRTTRPPAVIYLPDRTPEAEAKKRLRSDGSVPFGEAAGDTTRSREGEDARLARFEGLVNCPSLDEEKAGRGGRVRVRRIEFDEEGFELAPGRCRKWKYYRPAMSAFKR